MTPDEEIQTIQTLQQGQALLATLAVRVKRREEVILAKLVAASETGALAESAMRDGIAGIAALRGLIRDIERETKTAIRKSQEIAAGETH